jgi:uncharacterized protein (DUF486 family)
VLHFFINRIQRLRGHRLVLTPESQRFPLWKAILISWGIAFLEYCLTVPANRWGYTHGFNGFQLKITQEVITVVIFTFFAIFYFKEPFQWRYLLGFGLLVAAVYVIFKK